MRVTMKALCALPTGTLEHGRTYDLDPKRARQLVQRGYAVPVDEDPATGGQRKRRRNSRKSSSAAGETSGQTASGENKEDGSDAASGGDPDDE